MQASPLRVIALCCLMLGVFFLAKSVSIKTPKYVLHELLNFKVNKSRFFRKYINQKLDVLTGFLFMFLGFGILLYLEIEGLRDAEAASNDYGLTNWPAVIGATVVVILIVAWVLNKVTRFFSGKIFVEQVRFLVERHGYPLESDDSLVREMGRVMKVPMGEDDTVESYAEKVRARMKLKPRDPEQRPPLYG